MSAAAVVLSPVQEIPVQFPTGYAGDRLDMHSNESILIYLTVGGSVVPIRVLESDSIASVKLRIQKCKGFVVKNQKLVFGGRELARSNCLVRDYGITGGKFLHLVLKLADLLAITVRTVCGREFEVQIGRFRNVAHLKKRIYKEGKGFVELLDEDHELFVNGEKLDDRRLIDDVCRENDGVVHLVARKSAKVRAKAVEKDVELSIVAVNEDEMRFEHKGEFGLCPILINPKLKLPSVISDMIKSTYGGLASGKGPVRSSEGTGGAYFMSDRTGGKYVSVFKPIDEEPMAVNNPNGLPVSMNGEGLKRGTRVGEGAFREVAAYVLDHPRGGRMLSCDEVIGFAGVLPTTMVKCLHKGFYQSEGFKLGSLQVYVENDGSCEEMGPRDFPDEEVHKISVLDIRLANVDRHGGNILVRRGEKDGRITLVPIDHGYCLPEKFEDCTFEWLYWPQSHKPYSPSTLEYIASLDAEQDIALLKLHGWDLPSEPANILRISTMLLKKGAERGLTPFSIGSIMCRENISEESRIEKVVRRARASLLPGASESAFLEAVEGFMEEEIEKVGK